MTRVKCGVFKHTVVVILRPCLHFETHTLCLGIVCVCLTENDCVFKTHKSVFKSVFKHTDTHTIPHIDSKVCLKVCLTVCLTVCFKVCLKVCNTLCFYVCD